MGMPTLGSANRASERVGSVCNCSKESLKNTAPSDLDPRADNFRIIAVEEFANYLVAIVNYPNCTPYNGNKVLIYEDVSIKDITAWKLVDPHFLENKNFTSPIARFPYSAKGIKRAVEFALMLNN